MIEYIPTKRMRFDISVLMDNRWQIVGAVEDGRREGQIQSESDFSRIIKDVTERAMQIKATSQVQGVKVVMEAVRIDGSPLSREVVNLTTTGQPAAERSIRHHKGDVPLCQKLDNLYERPSILAVGMILRPMLDRLNLTPIELLTLKATLRSIQQKHEQAFNEAISVASRQQAAAMGGDQRARMDVLGRLVEEGYARLRLAETKKDLPAPKPGPGGFDAYLKAATTTCPASERRFWLLRGISQITDTAGSYLGKLELLLGYDLDKSSPAMLEVLDDAVACLLDQPETIRELLGFQIDMGNAILAMRDFADGLAPNAMAKLTGPLSQAIGDSRLPKSADAIWERMSRSLSGRQPLTKQGAKEEWQAVNKLKHELGNALPPNFMEPVGAALTRRYNEARNRLLER